MVDLPTPPEWMALVSGVKPALRLLRADVRARAEAAAAARRGFASAVVDLGDGRAIAYVGRTRALVDELVAAEAEVLPGTERGAPAAHRRLGLALGFPACCVEAFVERLARGVERLPTGQAAHEDYVAASAALRASRRVDARANVFTRDWRPGWLSHYPCRFDCASSLAYADSLRAAFADHAPAAAAAHAWWLGEPVALHRDGRRTAVDEATVDACCLRFDDPA
ncbi:MAG: hypothetical protein R3B06_05710 [Kofleriaceae bacterium]